MAVDKEVRGPLWVDGQFTVRVRGPGPEPGRIIRVRRPFALIGQIPGADIRIDDPAVDGRHAFLLLDRRGIFGVDLLSRSGTRFAGADVASSRLGAGDILEIAGRRVELLQLRIDGAPVDPPLSEDDPLGDAPDLIDLALEPLDRPGPPWRLGSALAFVGRGEACAIRIEDASASRTHCALLRGASGAHVIDLLGRRTLLNDRPVEGASALLDGDVLTIGRARFAARLVTTSIDASALIRTHAMIGELAPSQTLVRLADAIHETPALLGDGVAVGEASRSEILDVLRQFQADAATLLEAQFGQIEAVNREIAALREEVRWHLGPPPVPAEPLELDLIPPAIAPAGESANWLLDRIGALEAEGQSTWKSLLGRITSTIKSRNSSQPPQSLVTTRTGPTIDRHS